MKKLFLALVLVASWAGVVNANPVNCNDNTSGNRANPRPANIPTENKKTETVSAPKDMELLNLAPETANATAPKEENSK